MTKVNVKLNSIKDVKSFVNNTNKCNGRVTVKSDIYTVDGKSIMGIFSLNTANELTVELENDSDKIFIEKYIV